ncbi:MAG: transferrin-binding protein-like solute binding protein [Campylobacterales bacterium]|nr:transferrin-binding protein-like solute binding protein [Campylobacterales bacterium]
MKILILLLLLTAAIFASVGEISSIKGSGTVTRASSDIDATIGLKLEEKDILKTKEDAKLQIIFKDGTIVTVGKSSTFDIAAYVYDKAKSDNSKVDFGFLEGSFKSVTGQIGKIAPDKFNLKTKTATIGIRGTTIVGNQESVACTQGTITISSNGVTQIVPAGMFSRTPPNAPPTPPQPYVAGSIGDVEDTPAPGKKEKEKKEEDKKSDKAEKSSTTGEKSDKQGSAPNSKEEAPANSPAQSNAAPSKQESSSNGTPNVQPQASAATNGGASPNIDSRSLSNIDTPLPGLNNSAIPEQTVIQPNVHNIVPNVQNIISDIQKIVTVVQTVVDTEVKVVAETETIAVVVTPPVVTPPAPVVTPPVVTPPVVTPPVVTPPVVTPPVVTPPVVTPPVVTPPVVTPPVVTPPVVTPPVVTPPVVTGPTAAELQAIADALAAANAIAPIVSTTITSSSSLDAIANTTGLTKVQTSSGNDYLEYGHWDSVAINGETCVITPRFSYISGVVTSSDYVNQMIANANIYTPTATYIGEISSIVTNNGIPTVSGGDVTLVFDFFHKNFAGTLIVNEGNFKSVITGDVHKYGFDSMSVTKATDSAANITSGNLNGQFYGTTAQAAGGKFNLNSSNAGSVSGVFGAAKVVPIP